MQITAAQQVKLLGGVDATFENDSDSKPCTVIIDRDVEVIAENGLTTVKRTHISLRKSQVGKVVAGDRIVCVDEAFTVKEILSDDGIVIDVYVRG